jgi:hydrogenase nickel incorporation protein HypA/HybF
MHEAGIAQEIIKVALQNADGAKSIVRIGITVGNRSGVSVSSLEFALHALREGTLAAGCEFEFNEPKAAGHCAGCGKESFPDDYFASCPECGTPILEFSGGDRLSLDYVDIEE